MERICSKEDSAPTGNRHFVVWAVIGLVLSFVRALSSRPGPGGSAAERGGRRGAV